VSVFYGIGRYRCLVTDQAFMKSTTDKPMIVWKVRPESLLTERIGNDGEPYTDEEPTAQQYERTVRLVINEDDQQSIDFAILKLRFAGFTGTSFDELDLKGCDVFCDCSHGTYKNQPKEDWNLALPKRASKPLEHDGSLTRKLNAIFGRKLTEGATETPKPALAAVAGGGMVEDDDIPF